MHNLKKMEKKSIIPTNSNYGKPLFSELKYCLRCCLPETNENINFDDFGICKACRASEQKMHIDWDVRQKLLAKTLIIIKRNLQITTIAWFLLVEER